MKIGIDYYSSKFDRYYKLVNPDVPNITEDFKTVIARLAEKGETIDNNEVPSESAYINRMKQSTEVVYCFQDGIKIGFAYIMTNHVYGDVPIVASFVMDHSSSPIGIYAMFNYISTKYKKLRIYPHGSAVTDLKSTATKESLIMFHQKVNPYFVIDYNDIVNRDNMSYTKLKKYFNLKELRKGGV